MTTYQSFVHSEQALDCSRGNELQDAGFGQLAAFIHSAWRYYLGTTDNSQNDHNSGQFDNHLKYLFFQPTIVEYRSLPLHTISAVHIQRCFVLLTF